MQFKIRNTEVKLSFSFFALILLLLTTNLDKRLVLVVIFALLHEVIHLILIYKFSAAPKKVSLNLFGADILRSSDNIINQNSEILIHLSAPIFNLILSFICFLLNRLYSKNIQLSYCAEVNFILGIFNLIPFYNFDGGNALNNLLLKYTSKKASDVTMTCISLVITVVFSLISVWLFVKHKNNLSLVLMSGYMIFSLIFKK